MNHYLQENNDSNESELMMRNHEDEKKMAPYTPNAERKEMSTQNSIVIKIFLRNESEIKTLLDERKLRELIAKELL